MHEIAHLTGSYKRLRRKGVNCGNINENYAKEELRAGFHRKNWQIILIFMASKEKIGGYYKGLVKYN